MAIGVAAPDIYIPGVRQSWAGTYGWPLDGGPKKFILHSTETDSFPGCVDQLAHYLDNWANPHVVWDPWTGDMAMTGRADWAEGALVAGNKDGSVVLQVEAVGRAGVEGKRPFTDSPMIGWDKILAWADSWGIPRVFPAGPPLPYPQAYGTGSPRDLNIWANQSGYYGHSQVPLNDHGDPGLVDLAKIFPSQEDDMTPEEHDVLITSARALVQLGGAITTLQTKQDQFFNLVVHGDPTHYSLDHLSADVKTLLATVGGGGTADPSVAQALAELAGRLDNLTLKAAS